MAPNAGRGQGRQPATRYPASEPMQEHRRLLRKRIHAEPGIRRVQGMASLARLQGKNAPIHGPPATVAARMGEIKAAGAGGVIRSLRPGAMPAEVARGSICLFTTRAAPESRRRSVAAN